jgi:hypothetical protein
MWAMAPSSVARTTPDEAPMLPRRTASAVHVTARYGSASRAYPLCQAVVHLGRLLRTVFLCDYFLNDGFRRELLRALNRGEAVNALKRAIYTGQVASHPAKRPDEMQALADAHRGHQPARRVPFPGRALRRQIPTVCYCTENERIPS